MAPGSFEEKSNDGEVSELGSDGAESIVVSGTVRSIVTSITAEPTLDAVSVATARRARLPSGSTGHEASNGTVESVPRETQLPPAQPAEASEQLKNSTLATSASGLVARTVYGSASDAFTKPDGWVIEIGGAPVSTVQVCEAGVPSVLPAGSVARTSNVWLPSTRGPTVAGLAHGSQSMPPSRRHSKDEPGSLESNSNDGDALLEGLPGTVVKVVSGAAVSTVQAYEAGVGSVLPAPSIARTSKVWLPSASRPATSGLVHGVQGPASTRHSKAAPGSSDSNSKVGASSFDGSAGTSTIVVCGATVSTVQVYEAGVGSVFAAPSVARTSKS